MNSKRRQSDLLFCLLLAGLATFALWCGHRLTASRAAAVVAAQNLRACETLVNKIAALSSRPSLAALHARSDTELTRRIEEQAAKALLPSQSILRIEPRTPQRIADTAYLEQPTSLELRGVTLQQLITFLVFLLDEETELRVTTLRLTAPRHETRYAGQEQWSAELTLTYLIFSPISRPVRT